MHRDRKVQLSSVDEPHRVKILVLTQHRIAAEDFFFVRRFVNVIKMDLSYNKLHQFPTGFSFKIFPQIKTLLLHYNRFNTLKNLVVVTESLSLVYLTLFGNPLEEVKTRHFFVNQMPHLMLMDDSIVRGEERNPMIELTQTTLPPLSYPLVSCLDQDSTQAFFAAVLQELRLIRKYFRIGNPAIVIQKWWRIIRNKHRAERQAKKIAMIKIKLEQLRQNRAVCTEPILVDTTNQDRVCSVMHMHFDFWEMMRNQFGYSKLYAEKSYCMSNNIPYESQNGFHFIRKTKCSWDVYKKRHLLRVNADMFSNIVQRVSKNSKKEKRLRLKPRGMKVTRKQLMGDDRFRLNVSKMRELSSRYAGKYVEIVGLTPKAKIALVKREFTGTFIKKCPLGLPFVFHYHLERIAAAVDIQRVWRGFRARSKFDGFKFIDERNAAARIQKFIRGLKFIHRHKFLLEVRAMLKRDSQRYICLELKQLIDIVTYCKEKEENSSLFSIPFQRDRVAIIGKADERLKIVTYSERKPNPNYLNLSITNQTTPAQDSLGGGVIQILLKGAIKVDRFIDGKNQKCIRITYSNLQETRNRKFLLALKTYRMGDSKFFMSREVNQLMPIDSIFEQMSRNGMIEVQNETPTRHDTLGQSHCLSLVSLNQSSSQQIQANFLPNSEAYFLRLRYYCSGMGYTCILLMGSFRPRQQPTIHVQESLFNMNQRELQKGLKHSQRYQGYRNNQIARHELQYQSSTEAVLSSDKSQSNLSSPLNSDRYFISKKSGLPEMLQREQEHLEQKKMSIKKMKEEHQYKIIRNLTSRERSLENLRKAVQIQGELMHQKYLDLTTESKHTNQNKHQLVRNNLKPIDYAFEAQFVRRGNQQKYHRELNLLSKEAELSKIRTNQLEDRMDSYLSRHYKLIQQPKKTLRQQAEQYQSTKSQEQPRAVKETVKDDEEDRRARGEKAKNRKRKLIHSVFPEEYYPIKQAESFGFALPKIKK